MKQIFVFIFLIIGFISNSQTIEFGIKANYSIEIPNGFIKSNAVGKNVDLKFINEDGCSIVTIVVKMSKKEFEQSQSISDEELKSDLELSGLENIKIIKRGKLLINGVKSYVLIDEASGLYCYSTSRSFGGNVVIHNFSVPITEKSKYMAIIYRCINSFKIK